VNQINAAVTQLSQTTQQNASSSEELAATAEEMSSQAEQLQQSMSFFKLAGTAHGRAASTAIAHAGRRSRVRGVSRAAAAAPRGTAQAFPEASDAVPDEAHFARF
jgi:methyl-accepting chemotaxis protein